MAKVTHDAVITTGEYQHPETGETKKRYQKIGVVFTNDTGQMSMKLDALPCGPNWSGFISLYEKDRDQAPQQRPQERQTLQYQQNAQQAPRQQPTAHVEESNDIPF